MPNQHIVKRANGWAIMGEGNSRATALLNTQDEATDRARQILLNNGGGELVIHGLDGKIRQKDTISHPDYYPPRG